MTTYININGDVREASSLQVPQDRTFRGAWQFNGNVVEIDMNEARNIHKDHLRQEREELWGGLDASFMQALESGDTVAQQSIAGAKQVLRDVTDDQRIADAQTPDDLKALTLDVLTA